MEELKSRYDDMDFHRRLDHKVMIYYLFYYLHDTSPQSAGLLVTLHTFANSVLHSAYMLQTEDPVWRQSLNQLLNECDTFIQNCSDVCVELNLADIADKFGRFFREVRNMYFVSHT